jgi:two-component system capsular synthesis sensor histidine kinase RcsC
VLIAIITVSASLLAALANGKHLEYMRSIRAQDAASFYARSHRGMS